MITAPTAPRFEHHDEPLGIGEAQPRLSWQRTDTDTAQQFAYELEVARADVRSFHTDSTESVLVPWPDLPLQSREQVRVRVRIWTDDGAVSPWSEWATAETGLLRPEDWSAQAASPVDTGVGPLLRHEFELTGPIEAARLYITAHGLYEAELNGQRIGREDLAPGWTVYSARLRYQTYDITAQLREGRNAIGAWVGDGWYRGRLGFHGGHTNLYGDRVALLAQLEVRYQDGHTDTIATDSTWRSADGPIVSSGLYDGEHYDARAYPQGWSAPGFDDHAWTPVQLVERDPATLVAPDGPPVRCTQELAPQTVTEVAPGVLQLDFGQNFAGRLRVTLDGPAGHAVTFRHAEVLQDGRIYTRPLRDAKATDTYVLAGSGEETWEPRFTIHGFRYVEVEGWTGQDPQAAIRARVLHSDFTRTGWFESSNDDVNRLHENVVWSMRSNMVDIPTDCPQRDERLGWTGDIQVFAPTASYLYDVAGFLASWLQDVAVEQLPDGTVPWYVPVIPGGEEWTPIRPGAVWGDVAVLTPWTLWERYRDAEVLARQWPSARRWVELMERLSGADHLWDEGFQLGDWLDPAAPPEDPADARTDRYLVATAYAAHSTRRLAQTAEVLGRTADAAHFTQLADEIRTAFRAAYVQPDLRLTSDAPTAYALAIVFDLLDGPERVTAGDRLAELVREAGHRIATGFAGTPVISDALTATGHVDDAYALLLADEAPSWLYAVRMGATTIWERWDSMLPDGTVNPGGMTSFNHYALGAVADWLHRVVAGLAPDSAGYARLQIAPHPGGGLTHAAATHVTPFGLASVRWELQGQDFQLWATVPAGSSAEVTLPDGTRTAVAAGEHAFHCTVPATTADAVER